MQNMHESNMQNGEQQKPDTKEYLFNEFIHMYVFQEQKTNR